MHKKSSNAEFVSSKGSVVVRQMSHSEVQSESFRLLDSFTAFCEDHDLRYFLARGALLGAVREADMIAWDDDIDLVMPRSDYQRALRIWNNGDEAELLDPLEKDYPYAFAKLVSTKTYFEEPGVEGFPRLGVFLDILPIDGSPRFARRSWSRFITVLIYLYRQAHVSGQTSASTKFRSAVKRPVMRLAKALPPNAHKSLINASLRLFSFERSSMAKEYFSQAEVDSGFLPTTSFQECSYVLLRGRKVRTFRDPLEYLESKYGQGWRVPAKRDIPTHGSGYWRDHVES